MLQFELVDSTLSFDATFRFSGQEEKKLLIHLVIMRKQSISYEL